MKWLFRLLGLILVIFALLFIGAYWLLHQQKPVYNGTVNIKGFDSTTEVYFDTYGVPHIYAQNETDAFRALGYVHAQDRLFQMELIRRVATGTLSEILGEKLIKTDQLFRTLNISKVAKNAKDKYLNKQDLPYQKAAFAYLEGLNAFIEHGKTPIEFTLLGIPKKPFSATDLYLPVGYMAFGFAEGFRTDAILHYINEKLGSAYIQDLQLHHKVGKEKIPVGAAQPLKADSLNTKLSPALSFASHMDQIIADFPIPLWNGSNSWVLSGQKTTTGKPILANDTHVRYGQPAVWYEAHLHYPKNEFYGLFLAGFPFPPIAHNNYMGIGLTMLENDDVDFFIEKTNPDNPNEYWQRDHWATYTTRQENILVKNQVSIPFEVKETNHGPLINGLIAMSDSLDYPIATYWTLLHTDCKLLQSCYNILHAESIDEVRESVAQISAPGLNFMYADTDNNIAWWAVSNLIDRHNQQNSKFFLDGASGNDDYKGFLPFSSNPQNENPPQAYLYSANNQPDTMGGLLYPGYYAPEYRAKRIRQQLEAKEKWSMEDVQKLITDHHSTVAHHISQAILDPIREKMIATRASGYIQTIKILDQWEGSHAIEAAGPTVHYKLLYYTLKYAMEDEIGAKAFTALLNTHTLRRFQDDFVRNAQSPWWDDVRTKDKKETRAAIFEKAFRKTVEELKSQLGSNFEWGQVHTLTHTHPIGRQKPLDRLFNVGPFPVSGGLEVINNIGFRLNATGKYPAYFGPAVRRIVNFKALDHGKNVLPTGQSGNVMSPYYKDQAALYHQGQFRLMLMDKKAILSREYQHLSFSSN